MKKSDSIQDLFLKIADNNQEAFREFYDLFYSSVYRISGYYLKSEDLRQETVSDVFMGIWQSRKVIPKISNIEAYLFTSTKNRAFFYLKQSSKYINITLDDIPMGVCINDENPEKITITDELQKIIDSSIKSLPERCRLIFLMAREEGLKYRDIAEILSISEKTVNAQMVTAIKKITSVLRNYLSI